MLRLVYSKVLAMRRTIEKKTGYRGYDVLSIADGNDLIAQLLKSAEPAAIGKLGAVETQAIRSFIKYKGNIEKWDTGTKLNLYRNAGVFPPNNEE